jgi:hypothetical protein
MLMWMHVLQQTTAAIHAIATCHQQGFPYLQVEADLNQVEERCLEGHVIVERELVDVCMVVEKEW